MARLEGKSSLGRLGLLIHSTAGYVDPGWKGNAHARAVQRRQPADRPLSGMRIGQISFFRMSSPGGAAVRVARSSAPSTRASPSPRRPRSTRTSSAGGRSAKRADARGHQRRRPLARRPRRRDDASRSSRPARSGPMPGRSSGPCRGSCGAPGPRASWTRTGGCSRRSTACWSRRRPGACSSRPASGSAWTRRTRRMRGYAGTPIVPGARGRRLRPGTVDVVAMSHLHFDHAGGLLLADGDEGVPAGARSWPSAPSGRSRWAATAGRRLLRPAGAAARRATGARRAGPRGTAELLPGVSVVRTGGHSAGHQAIVVRGTGPGARPLAFFGDLCMRPWSANPRWVTAFDDFPLDSVEVKGELFRRAVEDDWTVVLSHEARMPVGRLVPDRDRFRFEGLSAGPGTPASRPGTCHRGPRLGARVTPAPRPGVGHRGTFRRRPPRGRSGSSTDTSRGHRATVGSARVRRSRVRASDGRAAGLDPAARRLSSSAR